MALVPVNGEGKMDGSVNGHEAERGKKGVKAIFERTRQKKILQDE